MASEGAEGWEKRRRDYREAFDADSGSGNPGVPSGESCSHTTSIMNERYLLGWRTELKQHTDVSCWKSGTSLTGEEASVFLFTFADTEGHLENLVSGD